jgi:hypothetical protein
MKKSVRALLLGMGLTAMAGLSLAADQPAGAAPAPGASPAATNVQTPATKPAKKKVKKHKSTKAHTAKKAAQ